MHFDMTITLGGVIQTVSIICVIFGGVWTLRGKLDALMETFQADIRDANEGTYRRHRQNTQRLDFMLNLINALRRDNGQAEIPCPYRTILDP